MNYSAAGPFLINPARLTEGSEVSYLSCGVPHDFAPSEMDEVRHTFEAARFIYLRDEQSAEKLRRAGVRREIHVAPDLIVLLSEQFNHAAEARRGREILLRFGVDVACPVLCFQSKPYPGFREEEIAKELERYRQRARAEVALLPLGFCHGDREFLRRLAKQSGGALKYIDVHSVFDAMRVIAACKMFVGTSLHGNVTAFSFGIPHLFGPLPVDKAEGFWNVTNLPPELKLRSWRELNDKLEFASEFDPAFFSGLAREASLKVHGAVDELLERLLN